MQNLKPNFIISFMLSAIFCHFLMADTGLIELQENLNRMVEKIVGTEKFIITVNQVGTKTKSKNDSKLTLPFSNLEIRQVEESDEPEKTEVMVTLYTDSEMPDATLNNIKDVITESYRESKYQIKIVDKKVDFSKPIKESPPKDELLEAKIKKEQADLEVARLRLELMKKEIEAKNQPPEKKDFPKSEEPQEGDQEKNPGSDFDSNPDSEEAKNTEAKTLEVKSMPAVPQEVSVLERFQNLGVAILLGLSVIAAFILGFGSLKKTATPIADAIKELGAGVETAGTKIGESSAQSGKDGSDGELPSTIVAAASPTPVQATEEPISIGGEGGSEFSEKIDDSTKEYIEEISKKLKDMSDEGNFGFYKEFIEALDDEKQIPMAVALLVSLESNSVRTMLKNLSSEHAVKIRQFLMKPGSLRKARSLRARAVQEFYGKLLMGEFLGSPLMETKGLEKITRMKNADLLKFVCDLDEADISIFLSCFSPVKLKNLLAEANKDEKEILLMQITKMPSVTIVQVKELLSRLASEKPDEIIDQENSETMTPDWNYYKEVMDALDPEEQEQFLKRFGEGSEISKQLQKTFLPFSKLAEVPEPILKEIFIEKSNELIASILFKADGNMRNIVIRLLPDIKQATVNEKLKELDDDNVFKARNEKKSLESQRLIMKYVISMVNEGVFELNEESISEGAINAA